MRGTVWESDGFVSNFSQIMKNVKKVFGLFGGFCCFYFVWGFCRGRQTVAGIAGI
jgi:hypothetical protein